jgi:hypothetical protein
MTFDPTSLPQRLYLAEAIRCYIKDKNIPLAFNKKPDGEAIDCLLTRLKAFKPDDRPGGIHLDRNAIREIASPADNKPYPPHAAAVAAFLEDEGYWPVPLHHAMLMLPSYFGAVTPTNQRILRRIEGDYVSYQYSSREPDRILIGHTMIRIAKDWGCGVVINTIRTTTTPGVSAVYKGVIFADHDAIHALLRAEGEDAGFPAFMHLDAGAAPEVLNGCWLGNARTVQRHLTSITLHNASYPEDDSPILPAHRDARIPEIVRRHMLCVLKHGPGNYPPEYVYRNPVETKPPAFDEPEPTSSKKPMGFIPRNDE